MCGSVAEWLGRWTCDQQVAGSNPGLSAVECNPEQVVNTRVPLSPSSIISHPYVHLWMLQCMYSSSAWLGDILGVSKSVECELTRLSFSVYCTSSVLGMSYYTAR